MYCQGLCGSMVQTNLEGCHESQHSTHLNDPQCASRVLHCVLSNKMHSVAVQLQYDIIFKSSSAGVCKRVTHDQYELACRAERAKQPDSMSMFPEPSEIPKDMSRLQNHMHDHRCAQV